MIAWRIVSEMTYNVSSGTLNLTHSLTVFFALIVCYFWATSFAHCALLFRFSGYNGILSRLFAVLACVCVFGMDVILS